MSGKRNWRRYLPTQQTVRVADLLENLFDKPIATATRADQVRVSAALQALGWERFRASENVGEWDSPGLAL